MKQAVKQRRIKSSPARSLFCSHALCLNGHVGRQRLLPLSLKLLLALALLLSKPLLLCGVQAGEQLGYDGCRRQLQSTGKVGAWLSFLARSSDIF